MESIVAKLDAALYPAVCSVNTYLSNYILVFLLVAVGLWYSIKTRFIQVRCFGEGMRRVFGNLTLNGKKHDSGMSSFQALATAIAAQVGTGNIVGASGAILTGGPGAIFWMWVIAFFGMATIYAEATLAQKTRIVGANGNIKGGFGKFLAGFFAVSIILALGFMGCMVQSNSIGSTMETAFGVPSWVMGIVLVIICAIIFLGGVQRLAAVTEKLVPIMAGVFLLGGLAILVCRIKYVPATFGMIFKYAFQPQAIIGGGFGYAIKTAVSQGAKRGLFSNEAGMGSTPHAHAQANVKDPHDQGVVAMIGVFIDTFVVLTLNALVIICGVIFLGGVQRLAAVTEKVVPVMAAIFLLGGLAILIIDIKHVPATFGMIFKYAFQPQAIIGGSFGYALKTAISQGAKRGLFSNEAGMGSTPHAHAQANVKHAHDQGVVAMIGVFIDTFVVLTLNALVIICTLYTKDGILATGVIPEGIGKTNLAQTAFGSVFGASLGAKFVAVCLLFFAFSTILSWNLFGKINADYLFGKKNGKLCSVIYTIIALVFIFLGTVSGSDFVWEVTDMFNNFIVLPNVIALFALTGMVVASLNEMKKNKLKV